MDDHIENGKTVSNQTSLDFLREKASKMNFSKKEENETEEQRYQEGINPLREERKKIEELANDWQNKKKKIEESREKWKEHFAGVFNAYKTIKEESPEVLESFGIATFVDYVNNAELSEKEDIKSYKKARKTYREDRKEPAEARRKLKEDLGVATENIRNGDLREKTRLKLEELDRNIKELEFNSPDNIRERKEKAIESFKSRVEQDFVKNNLEAYISGTLKIEDKPNEKYPGKFEDLKKERFVSGDLIGDGQSELSLDERKKIFIDINSEKLREIIERYQTEIQKFKRDVDGGDYSNLQKTYRGSLGELKRMIEDNVKTFDQRKKMVKQLFGLRMEAEFSAEEQKLLNKDPEIVSAVQREIQLNEMENQIDPLEKGLLDQMGMDETKEFIIRKDGANDYLFIFSGQEDEYERNVANLRNKEQNLRSDLGMGLSLSLEEKGRYLENNLRNVESTIPKRSFMESKEKYQQRINDQKLLMEQQLERVNSIILEIKVNKSYRNNLNEKRVGEQLKGLLKSLNFGKEGLFDEFSDRKDITLGELISRAKLFKDNQQLTDLEKEALARKKSMDDDVKQKKQLVNDFRYVV
jgi:hypothetical protein